MTISEIKAYLKANKIKYQTLSEKSGIPLGTLRNIFSDSQNINPRFDTMQKIEKALELEKTSSLAQNYYTEEEDFLVQTYRKLSKRDKALVLNLFSSLTANDSVKIPKH